MKIPATLFLATFLMAFSPQQTCAELLAYEGFNYDAESDLIFTNGGVGWAGPWGWRAQFDGKGSMISSAAWIESGSLSYGELSTTGNHLHLYGDLGSIETGRRLASVIEGAPGTTTYISFIGQRIGPMNNVETRPDGTPWDDPETPEVETYPYGDNLYPRGASLRFFNSDNGEKLQIGNYSNQSINEWSVFAGGSWPSGVSYSELAFVVMKIVHNGDSTVADDIYFWVNPDLSAGEDIGAAQIAAPSAHEVNDPEVPIDFSNLAWISPWAGNGGGDREHAEMLMDELRIGTTWESVTPTGTVEPTRIISLSGELSFGSVLVGGSLELTLTISNSGDSELTVTGITYPDGFSGDWASGTIAAGGSQDVTVTFNPIAAVSYSGTIEVASDATAGSGSISVSGSGSASITKIISLSGELDFGSVEVNGSGQATLSISNEGTGELTVNAITYPDGFSGDWASGTIAAGASQEVTVTFSPTAEQSYSGEIVIDSDATSGDGSITVSGTGSVEVSGTWGPFPIVNAEGDVNTEAFLGWINVTNGSVVLSYALDTYFYVEGSSVTESGAWVYVYNMSDDAPKGGDSTWAEYTVLASGDVNTMRFLGWVNILPAPYVYAYAFTYWVYAPEEYVTEAGAWVYVFNRN